MKRLRPTLLTLHWVSWGAPGVVHNPIQPDSARSDHFSKYKKGPAKQGLGWSGVVLAGFR